MASADCIRLSGQREIPSQLQTLTNALVTVAPATAVIFQLVFNNISGGNASVTVTDMAGTPLDLLTARVLATHTTIVLKFPEGQLMPGGFKWKASAGASINASCVGYYEGNV